MVRHVAKTDPDPFGFDRLTYITDRDQSQALNNLEEPCIIISASGMATAGRVKHHIMHNIDSDNNTILIVGYAEPNSLAGKLRNGDEEVRIFGDIYPVKAQVRIIDSYSAHGDYNEMIKYLSCQNKKEVKKIFLVHGSPESISAFGKKLKTEGYKKIIEPNRKDSFVLE
jgi:metallo-beta-lactamase family protein